VHLRELVVVKVLVRSGKFFFDHEHTLFDFPIPEGSILQPLKMCF
jgi:hypothetical protein